MDYLGGNAPIDVLDVNVLGLVLACVDRASRLPCRFVSRAFCAAMRQLDLASGAEAKRRGVASFKIHKTGLHDRDRKEWYQCNLCPCKHPGIRGMRYRCVMRLTEHMVQSMPLAVLQWAYGQGLPLWVESCHAAIATGNLEAVKWMRALPYVYCDENSIMVAVRAGHIGVVQWLHDNSRTCSIYDVRLYSIAIERGDLDMLKWLNPRVRLLRGEMVDRAANAGHLSIMQWCASQGHKPSTKTLQIACVRKDAEMAKWVRENM